MIGRRQFAKAFAGALAAFGIAKPSWVSAGGEKAPEGGFSPETGILTLDVKPSFEALADVSARVMARTGAQAHVILLGQGWRKLFPEAAILNSDTYTRIGGSYHAAKVAIDSTLPKWRVVAIPAFVGKWRHPTDVVSHAKVRKFGTTVESEGRTVWTSRYTSEELSDYLDSRDAYAEEADAFFASVEKRA